ncbi:MAG TPA: hypothetical protein VHK88_15625 [Aquihabitans sp.]|jgi:hypothetical protein|nr:hypothetical protein [Aquihabitans sp.]
MPILRPGPDPENRRRVRGVGLAVLVATALAVGACSNDGEDAAPTAEATMPERTTTDPASVVERSTTTTTPPTPEEEVEAAYLEIMDAYFRRLERPNPDDPSIAVNHSGSSAVDVAEILTTLSDAGQVARFSDDGPPTPKVERTEMLAVDRARLRSCIVDPTVLADRETGEVLNDAVSSRLVEAVLLRSGGAWKLDSLSVLERWADDRGCNR